MRVLQDLVLLSLLLLSISKVYSQEDKKTKELFNSGGYISDGYALDRNQVRFNQSSDFVFHYIPGGDRLTCITSKQVRDYNRHYNCIYFVTLVRLSLRCLAVWRIEPSC